MSGPQYASFRDKRAFPLFNQLPAEGTFHPDFYTETTLSVPGSFKKHWAFLSEIAEVERFTRLVLIVRDQSRDIARVAFYTEGRGNELERKLVKPGNTIVNLYGLYHSFADGSTGIRQEHISSVKIIPMSLDNVVRLTDRVIRYSSDQSDGTKYCHGCDERKADLHKCVKCGMFWYCNKDCQTIGWLENGHKGDCRVIADKDLQGMLRKDWRHFDEYIRMPMKQ